MWSIYHIPYIMQVKSHRGLLLQDNKSYFLVSEKSPLHFFGDFIRIESCYLFYIFFQRNLRGNSTHWIIQLKEIILPVIYFEKF